MVLLHQCDRLRGADTAGGALATGLIGEKTHGVERGLTRTVVLGQNDDCGRSDEASIGRQGIEIERDISERRR